MSQPEALELIDGSEVSLLETIDHLLNQGVVLTGDVVLGLAGIDLIYLRLSVLLCAADRILPRRKPEADG
jgi:gas vesicle protein GvpA/GvpJ/GvpM family